MLFSTNLSTELFEYAHAFSVTPEDLKARMLRNVDIIFDESYKETLREIIDSYRIWLKIWITKIIKNPRNTVWTPLTEVDQQQ